MPNSQNTTGQQQSGYDAVNWDQLSDYAKYRVEQIADQEAITLHHATDAATLRRLIRIYRNTGW
jgi:hypothetical protein